MLRALILMLRLRYESIAQFAQDLRRSHRLAILAGFQPLHTPAVGAFYLFIDRLEDGPFTPPVPIASRPPSSVTGGTSGTSSRRKPTKKLTGNRFSSRLILSLNT